MQKITKKKTVRLRGDMNAMRTIDRDFDTVAYDIVMRLDSPSIAIARRLGYFLETVGTSELLYLYLNLDGMKLESEREKMHIPRLPVEIKVKPIIWLDDKRSETVLQVVSFKILATDQAFLTDII